MSQCVLDQQDGGSPHRHHLALWSHLLSRSACVHKDEYWWRKKLRFLRINTTQSLSEAAESTTRDLIASVDDFVWRTATEHGFVLSGDFWIHPKDVTIL